MGPFGGNVEEGRGDTYRVPETDHEDASKAVMRQGTADAGRGRRTRGSGNTVDEDLNILTTGNRGSVGGTTSLTLGM